MNSSKLLEQLTLPFWSDTLNSVQSRFPLINFSQEKGLDFEQTFSATMRATSFRTLVALAAANQMKLEHLDVRATLLPKQNRQ